MNTNFLNKLIIVASTVVLLSACSSREVRETKNSSTGNPKEKYEVIEINGSFLKMAIIKAGMTTGSLKKMAFSQKTRSTESGNLTLTMDNGFDS